MWTEGSFGMLMAMEQAQLSECQGHSRAEILKAIESLVHANGGVPYGTPSNDKNFSPETSIAGTAWLYFTRVGFNPFQP